MSEQKWRVTVDRDICIGSGMCVGTASNHFTLVDGHSTPTSEVIAPDDTVADAAEYCPVEAILIRAADSGEVIAPQG
ncbi:ferredoxin [Nocardia sp. NPDC051570]|uniref:ferredoxin n=1 Tax=Nocardia sp. NPDC051570 TaxID=3364324 RepID=UPI003797FD32